MDDVERILELLQDKAESEDGMAFGYLQADDEARHRIHLARAEALREFMAELGAARIPRDASAASVIASDRRSLVITEVSGPYRATMHFDEDAIFEAELFESRHEDLRQKCVVKCAVDRIALPPRPPSARGGSAIDVRWVYIEDIDGMLRGRVLDQRSQAEALKASFEEREEASIEAGEAWSRWHSILVPHQRDRTPRQP